MLDFFLVRLFLSFFLSTLELTVAWGFRLLGIRSREVKRSPRRPSSLSLSLALPLPSAAAVCRRVDAAGQLAGLVKLLGVCTCLFETLRTHSVRCVEQLLVSRHARFAH